MQAIMLQIVGLLIIVTLIILFYSKPNINNIETKTYSKIILLNLLFINVGILTYIIAKLTEITLLIGILQKTYMSILALLNMYSMIYCLSIYDKEKKYNNIKKGLYIITNIAIILIIILPLNVIYEGELLDGEGLSYDAAIGHTILSFLFFLITTINLSIKKKSIKKVFPFILLIVLYLIGFFIREYYKELIFEGFFYSYILFIMYFTIENPDVKLAKELAYQKQIAEASTNKTLSLLEDMSNELNSSIEKLETFGNKKIDKKNIDELKKEITNFQKESITLSNRISNILDLAMIKTDESYTENKYETTDLINKLKQLLTINNKIKITISDELPIILYGDEKNIIKLVIYLFNTITSLSNNKIISLKVDSIQVGRFSRLRFKFILPSESIKDYLYLNNKTNEIELKITDDITNKLIYTTLKKFNGKIFITEKNEETSISMFINQRVITEYDIISNNKVNKDINIEYQDYSNKRILIINNNETKNKEMKELLKPYNLDIRITNSIPQTVNTLSRNATFDLIIIDESIASINNNEILKEIKKEANYPITTIIMVNPNNKEKEHLKQEYNDYIAKPINMKSLDNILNKYFNKKER